LSSINAYAICGLWYIVLTLLGQKPSVSLKKVINSWSFGSSWLEVGITSGLFIGIFCTNVNKMNSNKNYL
jgi:hypothetical protein